MQTENCPGRDMPGWRYAQVEMQIYFHRSIEKKSNDGYTV